MSSQSKLNISVTQTGFDISDNKYEFSENKDRYLIIQIKLLLYIFTYIFSIDILRKQEDALSL